MALAKTILALAPLILKARSRRPVKRLAGVALSITLIFLASVFLMIAGFVWVMKSFGAEFGFLALGILFLVLASVVYFVALASKEKPISADPEINSDLLVQYLPEEMKNDPRILAVIENIKEHPVGSTAAAVALGFIISNLILGD